MKHLLVCRLHLHVANKRLKCALLVSDARTVVVVGGGPVGVELAAEIAFKHPGARIVLVHSASRLLNDFTEGIAAHSERWLRQVGGMAQPKCCIAAWSVSGFLLLTWRKNR